MTLTERAPETTQHVSKVTAEEVEEEEGEEDEEEPEEEEEPKEEKPPNPLRSRSIAELEERERTNCTGIAGGEDELEALNRRSSEKEVVLNDSEP